MVSTWDSLIHSTFIPSTVDYDLLLNRERTFVVQYFVLIMKFIITMIPALLGDSEL